MMHIVFAIDEKFTRFCTVAMASVMAHNKDVYFHIVTNSLPSESKDILREQAMRGNAGIEFHEVPGELVSGFKIKAMSHRISLASFYRCVLPSLLPANLDRVIYLDSDVVVEDSLDGLWNADIDGVALGAMTEARYAEDKHCERLGFDPSFVYFNAGVLLLNLDYWRKHDIEEQCRQHYNRHADKMLYNDQDLLNSLLYDKKKILPTRFNVQDAYYRKYKDEGPLNAERREMLLHPAVLHYTNRKPWEYHCMHPMRNKFYDYQQLTRYAGLSVLNNPLTQLHRTLHLLPYTLGMKPAPYYKLSEITG